MVRAVWWGFVVCGLLLGLVSIGLSFSGVVTPMAFKWTTLGVGAVAMAALMTAIMTGDFPGSSAD